MSEPSSFVSIDEVISRYVHAQLVYVTAKLGLADVLCDIPRTVEDLATLLEINPDALSRVVSSLVLLGILEGKENDRYQLASGHEVLRSDHPHSIHSYVIVSGEVYYRAFGNCCTVSGQGKQEARQPLGKVSLLI